MAFYVALALAPSRKTWGFFISGLQFFLFFGWVGPQATSL